MSGKKRGEGQAMGFIGERRSRIMEKESQKRSREKCGGNRGNREREMKKSAILAARRLHNQQEGKGELL